MSADETAQVMRSYLEDHDINAVAPDAVFTVMGTGEQFCGRDAIQGMLRNFYTQAFDAEARRRHLIIGAGHAVLEATFAGRHIGKFAGIAATGKQVEVPLCVVYDVEQGAITAGRVYFEMDALRAQLQPVP